MKKILYCALAAVLAVAFASCEKKSNKGTGDEPASWVNPNLQDGVMLHTFSVAANRPVRFSQGNLQYRASTGTWRFAPKQWEMRGEENNQRGEDYSGWIDLFCWGATGYNGRLPYVVPTSSEGFRQGDIANTDYDWGHYLPIANGGNQANRWRTLTLFRLISTPTCNSLWLSVWFVDRKINKQSRKTEKILCRTFWNCAAIAGQYAHIPIGR